jgi:putative oxidoreductase
MNENIKIILKTISVILISILFVNSGIDKILFFNKTVNGFQKKSNFSLNISKVAIVFAILFTLIAPILLMLSVILNNNFLLLLGCSMLIIFIILANIFYQSITDPKERNDFFKNFSIMGGLLMMLIYSFN